MLIHQYIILTVRNVRGPTLNAGRITPIIKKPTRQALLVLPLFVSLFTLRFALQKKKEETAEQAGSGVGDVRVGVAKRKRECGGEDEVELARSSKRLLPPSPSVAPDAALSSPSPSAREPPMLLVLLEAQRQNAAFAEGHPETPDARRLRRRGRLAKACLAAACVATTILIARVKW